MAFPSVAEECTAWCAPWPFQSLPPLSQNETHRKTPVNATISCVGSFISLPPILFGSVILLILGSIVLGISFVLWWICFPERSSVGVYPPNTIIAAFHKAYQSRNISYGLIFHSDQGAEYTASSFRKLLDANNIVQSFSKKGCPFDNSCCESFFKILKKNCTNRRTYHSLEELRLDIFNYIENLYNNRLPHGSLAYKTPNEFEADFFNRFSSV